MRAFRKRFTQSRARSTGQRERAVKTLEGVSAFRNSIAGRGVKAERLAAQWQLQHHLCDRCHVEMSLGECKFRDRKWERDAVNPAVHKNLSKCTKGAEHANEFA